MPLVAAEKLSNPLEDETVDYGPMINQAGFDKIVTLLDSAVNDGAQILCGGKRGADESGYYFEPTVVAGCTQAMDIVTKEIFGPVIPIVIGDELAAFSMAKRLQEEGVFANPIVPPAVPPSQAMIRTSYMATHTREHLDQALTALAKVGRELDVI